MDSKINANFIYFNLYEFCLTKIKTLKYPDNFLNTYTDYLPLEILITNLILNKYLILNLVVFNFLKPITSNTNEKSNLSYPILF